MTPHPGIDFSPRALITLNTNPPALDAITQRLLAMIPPASGAAGGGRVVEGPLTVIYSRSADRIMVQDIFFIAPHRRLGQPRPQKNKPLTDTQRINWLEKNEASLDNVSGYREEHLCTVRFAIDALARSEPIKHIQENTGTA